MEFVATQILWFIMNYCNIRGGIPFMIATRSMNPPFIISTSTYVSVGFKVSELFLILSTFALFLVVSNTNCLISISWSCPIAHALSFLSYWWEIFIPQDHHPVWSAKACSNVDCATNLFDPLTAAKLSFFQSVDTSSMVSMQVSNPYNAIERRQSKVYLNNSVCKA